MAQGHWKGAMMVAIWLAIVGAYLAPTIRALPFGDWGPAWEGTPAATDPIADGAVEITDFKEAVRERGEVEHCWDQGLGILPVGQCDVADTGVHRTGSAVLFEDNDCSGYVIPAEHQNGWICRDNLTPGTGLWVTVAGAWEPLDTNPTGTVIMYDDGTNDCAASCLAIAGGEYVEYTALDDALPRGRDISGLDPDVPDDVNRNCYGAVPDAACTGAATQYDDIIQTGELAAHNHDAEVEDLGGLPAKQVLQRVNGQWNLASTIPMTPIQDEGNDDPHYHPFRTMCFCQKQ